MIAKPLSMQTITKTAKQCEVQYEVQRTDYNRLELQRTAWNYNECV